MEAVFVDSNLGSVAFCQAESQLAEFRVLQGPLFKKPGKDPAGPKAHE